MLGIVKGAAIIGVIYLLSPVRAELASPPGRADLLLAAPAAALALPPLPAGADAAALAHTWRSLPDGTRQRLLKLLAEEAGGPGEAGAETPRR